jgi:predicted RNA-binding protein YlxR (DUF448 family)
VGGVDSRSSPLRTCVGCRQRTPQSDLIRVVAVGGALVPDPLRRMPGRGAHVHPVLECLDRAEQRRAFPRALKVEGPLDSRLVRTMVELSARHDPGARPDSTRPASAGADRE